jgi:hypothetical protein
MMRWLLLALFTAASVLPPISAGPPAAPVPSPQRIRVNRGFDVIGRLYRHTDAAEAAAGDMAVLSKFKSPEELCYYRYLSVHNLPPDWRLEMLKLSSWALNSLSKNDIIIVPAVGGPDNILIRVNLFDYGIDPKVWDKFGETDPYFHQKIVEQKIVTIGTSHFEWVWEEKPRQIKDGTWWYYQVQREKTVVKETHKVERLASAAWLDSNAMLFLINTTKSSSPILRADWFLTYATLSPTYYDFTGFKTLDDYLNFVGWDKRADRREVKATIVTSGGNGKCPRVSRHNRILAWRPTFNGGVWETFDYNKSTGTRNVINNFLNNTRDAGEYIGNGGNGLQYYFLVDGKNKRLNEGTTDIVVDSMALDVTVKNGRSCMWCHTKGINDFTSQFQLQVGARPDQADLGISGQEGKKVDPKEALALQQYILKTFGTPNFCDIIASGNATYARAVRLCNNLTPEENATLFKKHWDGYFEGQLDMNRIVYELGYTENEVKSLMSLRLNGKDDGVLLQQLLTPPIAIRRDHWEESFARIALLSTLIKRPPPTEGQK